MAINLRYVFGKMLLMCVILLGLNTHSQTVQTISTTYSITPAVGSPKVLFWAPFTPIASGFNPNIRTLTYLSAYEDYTGDAVTRSPHVARPGVLPFCFDTMKTAGYDYGITLQPTDVSTSGCTNLLGTVSSHDHFIRFAVRPSAIGNPRFKVQYSTCIIGQNTQLTNSYYYQSNVQCYTYGTYTSLSYQYGYTYGTYTTVYCNYYYYGGCTTYTLTGNNYVPTYTYTTTQTGYYFAYDNYGCLAPNTSSYNQPCGVVYSSCQYYQTYSYTGYYTDCTSYTYSTVNYTNSYTYSDCTFIQTYDCGNPHGPCSSYSCATYTSVYSGSYVNADCVGTSAWTYTQTDNYCASTSYWTSGSPWYCADCYNFRQILEYDITVFLVFNKDLAVTKTSNKTTYNSGEVIEFTVTATNNDALPITTCTVNDIWPAGLTLIGWETTNGSYNTSSNVWTINNLPGAGQAVLKLRAVSSVTGSIKNIAQGVLSGDINLSNNNDTVTINVNGPIQVNPLPPRPCDWVLKGDSVCKNATNVQIQISPVNLLALAPAGTTITWSVPSGWTIVAGQGTSTLTVNVGTFSGYVSATIVYPPDSQYGRTICEKSKLVNILTTPNPTGINK